MSNRYFLVPIRSPLYVAVAMLHKERVDAIKARRKLCRELKAHEFTAASGSNWGVIFKSGLCTDKRLRLSRGGGGVYVPRLSSKEGKALHERMRDKQYHLPGGSSLRKIIGVDLKLEARGGGMFMLEPGYAYIERGPHAGKIVLIIRGDEDPKGCKRISDLEYEKITADHKPKKKAKR